MTFRPTKKQLADAAERGIPTPAEIKAKISSDDRWATRALLSIYENQTSEEQSSQSTIEDNGIGFNGTDAEFLSSIAQGVLRYGQPTPRQMPHVRKKMPKYANQLFAIAMGAA